MSANAHHSLHHRVEDFWGSGDLRMLYGMAAPLLTAVALIVGMLVADVAWLVAVMLVIVVALTAVVLVGVSKMLGEDEED